MTPIGRYPAGLLELIGSKSNGVQPTAFREDARFTLDLTPFFGTWAVERAVDTTLAESQSVTITVPNGAWWRLVAASMHVSLSETNTGIAGSIRLSPEITSANTAALARGVWNEDQLNPTSANLGPALVTFVPPTVLVLPPGATLWGTLDVLGTDPTLEAALQVLYVPLT